MIDINESTIKNFIHSIRPKDEKIRAEIDFDYSFDGKVALLYEIRPFWNDPTKKTKMEFAKIRFYKTKNEWNLYWMRASGNWKIYEPLSKSSHLEKLLNEIKNDPYGCFFG